MESAILTGSACSLKALSLLNHTVQSAFPWSSSSDGMVCGPDHGPGIDVKEAAARSRLTIPVADAMLIACCLPVSHGVRDRPSISSGHKRQSAQDVGERDHVHHRVRVWTVAGQVEHLSSNMGSAWPPQTCLPRVIVPQSLNHCAFALLKAARISMNMVNSSATRPYQHSSIEGLNLDRLP